MEKIDFKEDLDSNEMLGLLSALATVEYYDIVLSDEQKEVYVTLVETLRKENVEIPFGISM